MFSIPKRDWKQLRKLQPALLNHACEKIFLQVDALSANRTDKQHERYLQLWQLIQKEDKLIADTFNDLKPSNAIAKIMFLKSHGLLSEQQFASFSEETQTHIQQWFDD